ncbi:MAG: hypothetical protein ACREOF_22265 [Gemmatimonadales bacterium]
MSIRKAVVGLAAVLMASALPAAAQQSLAETDSTPAQIRTTLRAFYFNLAHQDWEALSADILTAKVVAHRPAPEAMVAAAPRVDDPPACSTDVAARVDRAAVTLDGEWAEVSVPSCAAAGRADEFRFIRFEGRWRIVYIDLFRASGAVQLAR